MEYDLRNIKFKPRRLKILWNWEVPIDSLVSVLPNTVLERKSDVAASIEGRCFFASPQVVDISSLVETVEKALIEDVAGSFFLCGFMDYVLSFDVTTKLVLDDIKRIIEVSGNNPSFLQNVIESRLNLLMKALGFKPPPTASHDNITP